MAQDYNEVDLNVINDEELLQLFRELDPKVQAKIINGGMRKAAQIILQATKQSLNSVKKGKSKTNYKNVNSVFKIAPLKSENNIGVKVGITKAGYKYRWLQWGTNDRSYTIKKKSLFKKNSGTIHTTGKVAATNFFYSAVEASKEQAQKTVSQAIIDSMNKTVDKYNNAGKK